MRNKIREGRKSDLSEILRLNENLAELHAKTDDYFLPGSKTRKSVKDWLESVFEDDNAFVLVVEEGDGLGGYFIGLIEETKPFIKPDFEGRISDAYLEPQVRGKGFARLAYERLKEWFKDNDINSIRLSVHSENEDAISAWRSLGFEEYMKRMKVDI
ncbi:GNAT family N-acetyltransferase [Candidatus Bipolaricaulota bacterium]|nr:GNAT family N-acetyltransferase [Candidatus Bipolaricaulota bacterium]